LKAEETNFFVIRSLKLFVLNPAIALNFASDVEKTTKKNYLEE
jgi:hypothetical protein